MGNLSSNNIEFYSPEEHYKKITKEIPNNAFHQLERYLSQKDKPIRLHRIFDYPSDSTTFTIRYFTYLSRAQESTVSETIEPGLKYIYFYLHGSDMSGILAKLPNNVCAISFNADGIKDIHNEDLLSFKSESSTLVICLLKYVLILLFSLLLVVLSMFYLPNQGNKKPQQIGSKYIEITSQNYSNGKGTIQLTFDMKYCRTVEQQLLKLGVTLNIPPEDSIRYSDKKLVSQDKITSTNIVSPTLNEKIEESHDTVLVQAKQDESQAPIESTVTTYDIQNSRQENPNSQDSAISNTNMQQELSGVAFENENIDKIE